MTAIARFNKVSSLIYAASVTAVLLSIVLGPVILSESPADFVRTSTFGPAYIFAMIAIICFVPAIIILVTRVVLFDAIAIYEKNGNIVYQYPIIFRISIEDIDVIESADIKSLFFTRKKIIITNKSGRMRFISTSFIQEDTEAVISRLKGYLR